MGIFATFFKSASASPSAIVPAVEVAAESAIHGLVARYAPAALIVVNSTIDKAESAIGATTPQTIVSLEDQLHSSVSINGWAAPVVSALQSATSVVIATGAAQYGIAAADDLSKAQLEKLRTALVAKVNALAG